MASIPGGPSNTLSSEFQALWIARLLLDVLAERVRSVAIEPAGGDAYKAECFVHLPDGTTEAHQCKMHRASEGRWTAADVEREGVISAANTWLAQSPSNRYAFVSGDPTPGLRDLCARATEIEDIADFWHASASNEILRRDRAKLVAVLGVDVNAIAGQMEVRDFLRRFRVELRPVDHHRRDVADRAASLVLGDPAACVRLLESLANTTYQRTLAFPEVAAALRGAGFELSDLAKDTTLAPAVEAHNERFHDAIRPLLINGRALGRAVTDEVLAAGRHQDVRIVLVHGGGGCGKTGVIYEVVDRVRTAGDPYLVISLNQDRLTPRLGRSPHADRHLALPVETLETLGGDRTAWLFIDQLDAVRWTADHAAGALDEVKDIIRRAARSKYVRLVIACRSFDAEDDKRIRTLFETIKDANVVLRRVEVRPLSDEERDHVLRDLGVSPNSFGARQRLILRNPQHLWLLGKLITEGEGPTFTSAADLNGRYWAWLRREQLTDAQRGELDDRLLPSLLKRDRGSSGGNVPQDLRHKHSVLLDRLQSAGVLVGGTSGGLRFAHQSHYDYLAAERMSAELGADAGAVVDWCRTHDDLFHRNQLRQYLEMRRVDDPDGFVQCGTLLLQSDGVRFHLKAITLGVLGTDTELTASAKRLVGALLEDPVLRPHVIAQARANIDWFRQMDATGALKDWLTGPDKSRQQDAFVLLRSHAANAGDVLLRLFAELPPNRAEESRSQAYWALRANEVTKEVFADYLDWLRRTPTAGPFFNWKELSKSVPRRCVDALTIVMKRGLEELSTSASTTGDPDDMRYLMRAATEEVLNLGDRFPLRIMSACNEALRSLWSFRRALTRRRKAEGWPTYDERKRYGAVAHVVTAFAVAAGRNLARRRPDLALRLARRELQSRDRLRQRVTLRSLAALPRRYADVLLELMIVTPTLLACGPRRYSSKYRGSTTSPARRAILRFGRRASDTTLFRLEQSVRRVIPARELRDWRAVHEMHMDGGWLNTGKSFGWIRRRTLFVSQYLLLDAFPPDRLSNEGLGWLGVLREKFGDISNFIPEPPRGRGGTVSPSIPADRARRFTDRQWLDLIASEKANAGGRLRRWRDDFTDSSPEMFARLLLSSVRREPARFAALALRFPEGADDAYISAVLSGLAETKPPEDVAVHEWSSATLAATEAVVSRFRHRLRSRDVAMGVCRLVKDRAEELWSADTIELIGSLAINNPDPQANSATVHTSSGPNSEMRPDYVSTAMNCVRGVACEAWKAMAWTHRELVHATWLLLDELAKDPHPSVRIAATGICLPMLNVDRSAAMDACLRLLDHDEDAVLEGHHLGRFLSYTLSEERMRQVPERMGRSSNEIVAKAGAAWTTLLYLETRANPVAVDKAAGGTAACRRGVGEVLGRQVAEHLGDQRVMSWMSTLLNDDDEKVRAEAATFVFMPKFFEQHDSPKLVHIFMNSAAFVQHLDGLIHTMTDTNANLTRFASEIASIVRTLSTRRDSGGHDLHMAAHQLPDLLLRFYEQAPSDSEARRVCLDALDETIRSQLAYDLLPKID
jgi:hypothetical protein